MSIACSSTNAVQWAILGIGASGKTKRAEVPHRRALDISKQSSSSVGVLTIGITKARNTLIDGKRNTEGGAVGALFCGQRLARPPLLAV